MSSLLPEDYGCGTRDNIAKRKYVFKHLADVEYRCRVFPKIGDAKLEETRLRRDDPCIFNT